MGRTSHHSSRDSSSSIGSPSVLSNDSQSKIKKQTKLKSKQDKKQKKKSTSSSSRKRQKDSKAASKENHEKQVQEQTSLFSDQMMTEMVLGEFDHEVSSKCQEIRTMAQIQAEKLRAQLKAELMRLPANLRQMTVRDYQREYAQDSAQFIAQQTEDQSFDLKSLVDRLQASVASRQAPTSARAAQATPRQLVFGPSSSKQVPDASAADAQTLQS